MKTLQKILGAVAIAGLITLGAGLIAKSKVVDYIGAGTFIAGTCGYILNTGKPYNTKR